MIPNFHSRKDSSFSDCVLSMINFNKLLFRVERIGIDVDDIGPVFTWYRIKTIFCCIAHHLLSLLAKNRSFSEGTL